MQTQMQIFEHDEFGKLEVLMIDGKPFFPATACAKTLGYSNPQEAIRTHCKGVRKMLTPTLNQHGTEVVQNVNYIPEGDLYRLIIRSKLPEAVKFEAFVCDTILPSIRKYGGYVMDNALDQLIDNPEVAMKFFTALKAERTKNDELENYIEEIAPKALYYDIVLQYPDAIQVSIIAKDYGYSGVVFNSLLHAFGVQYKVGKTWLLYREHDNKGYTVSKTYQIGETITAIHTCFTQKGRCFIYELLKSKGILPLAERTAENHE